MIRTIVFGAGRMATRVVELAVDDPGYQVIAQVARSHPGPSAQPSEFETFGTLSEVGGSLEADLLIDFTLPDGTRDAARWCAANRVALLSGVTGIGPQVHAALDDAAKSIPVLWAANLGFGINLMARQLRDLGQVVDAATPVTIEETHHAGKKDAPSGTALFLARQLREPSGPGAGFDPNKVDADFPGIAFVSHREGDVVGDHSVRIALRDETLTLAHHAADRGLFARGALDAGRWLVSQKAGRYSAGDWIRKLIEGEVGPNGHPGVA